MIVISPLYCFPSRPVLPSGPPCPLLGSCPFPSPGMIPANSGHRLLMVCNVPIKRGRKANSAPAAASNGGIPRMRRTTPSPMARMGRERLMNRARAALGIRLSHRKKIIRPTSAITHSMGCTLIEWAMRQPRARCVRGCFLLALYSVSSFRSGTSHTVRRGFTSVSVMAHYLLFGILYQSRRGKPLPVR